MKKIVWLVFALSAISTAGFAANDSKSPLDQWPNWRGPLSNGVSPHGNPPVRWDEKTNVKWKVDLPGKGSSTPIVWGDNVFVAAAVDTGRTAKAEDLPKFKSKVDKKAKPPTTYYQFILFCFERQTGKVRWKQLCTERVPHEGYQATHSHAAGSPTTDGKHVWVAFGSRGVYCYDFNGKLIWQRELGLITSRLGYGEATTPVLHGDDLLINFDQEFDSKLIVLNANTGKTRLEINRDEPTTWHTPLVVEHKGVTQVIMNGTNRVRGYDLKTGELLWQAGGTTLNAIPSPVADNDVAYIMGGFQGSMAMAVPLESRGDIKGTKKVLWTYKKNTPYMPSPLLIDDRLYFTQSKNNFITCLDAKTGKPLYERIPLDAFGEIYSSPVAAAGRIYLIDRVGVGLVFKQSDKFEILATNTLKDKIDASPAIVGKQMFLRGHKHLYCIEEKQ